MDALQNVLSEYYLDTESTLILIVFGENTDELVPLVRYPKEAIVEEITNQMKKITGYREGTIEYDPYSSEDYAVSGVFTGREYDKDKEDFPFCLYVTSSVPYLGYQRCMIKHR